LSFGSLIRRFLDVLDEFDRIVAEQKFRTEAEWDRVLLDRMDALLDALMEHMDDCMSVLKTLFPATDERWTNNHHIKRYRKETNSYRDHIGLVVNKIKHEQARLRTLIMFTDSWVAPGYFIEGVYPDGSVGPHPVIHPGTTAFSFARDLRFHFRAVYAVSHELAKAVSAMTGAADQPVNIIVPEPPEVVRLLERMTTLPLRFFPQEVTMKCPWVHYSNGRLEIGSIEPAVAAGVVGTGHCQISCKHEGDGVTRSFKMPYYAGSRP
jgi:hypothetical protein